jgi:hypothetical protein
MRARALAVETSSRRVPVSDDMTISKRKKYPRARVRSFVRASRSFARARV